MSDEEKKEMPFITKALIVAIIAVVVVVFSAVVSFVVSTSAVKSIQNAKTTEESAAGAHGKEAEAEEEHGPIINFGEYTLNLNEPEPTFLVCQISFEMEPEKADAKKHAKSAKKAEASAGEPSGPTGEMAEKLIILQDIVQTILRSKSKADLAADPKLVALKKEIKDAINGVLKTQKVKNVYFGKWMVQ